MSEPVVRNRQRVSIIEVEGNPLGSKANREALAKSNLRVENISDAKIAHEDDILNLLNLLDSIE